jgi:Transposase DDE domain
LFEEVAGPVGDEQDPGVSCCGLRVVSMDGSTSDVPDSEPGDEHFGRPSDQSRDGAFAQVRWLAAAESGTGSLLGASIGPCRDSEQALARDLLEQGCFGPGMLVLADRKFLSWALATEFLATGAHILWRASAAFALKPVKVLADGTYLAELKPPRKSDGPPLPARVIEYTVHTAPEDGGGEENSEVFCLVASLLDPQEYPALDLARRYPARWGCETVIGHHKTGMGVGQPVLRSRDPAGVEQEMWALFAVYQAICKITGAGAAAAGVPRSRSAFRTPWPPRRTRSRLFPLSRLISRSPRSCSRSSPRAPSPGTARTGPAPARPRKPATSRPADPASLASPTSSGDSSSTCSAHT